MRINSVHLEVSFMISHYAFCEVKFPPREHMDNASDPASPTAPSQHDKAGDQHGHEPAKDVEAHQQEALQQPAPALSQEHEAASALAPAATTPPVRVTPSLAAAAVTPPVRPAAVTPPVRLATPPVRPAAVTPPVRPAATPTLEAQPPQPLATAEASAAEPQHGQLPGQEQVNTLATAAAGEGGEPEPEQENGAEQDETDEESKDENGVQPAGAENKAQKKKRAVETSDGGQQPEHAKGKAAANKQRKLAFNQKQ